MQLEFLDEPFDANDCHKMCDNCKSNKKIVVSKIDRTREAFTVAKTVELINRGDGRVTIV